MNRKRLLTDRLSILFLQYVFPSIIAMVLSGIQGMVDGIFLGNFVGSNAMASVNIANPFLQLIIGSAMIVCTGTLSYLGRIIGENNINTAKDIFKSALIGLGVISITILLSGVLFHDKISVLLGANQALFEFTSDYLLVISIFTPFIAFMLLFGFVNRLLGKPQLYLYATVVCLISNVVLDFVFLKVFNLGIIGAAMATGISYLLGFLIVLKPIISRKNIVNIFEGRFRGNLFLKAVQNGSSEGVTYISTALTLFLFNLAFIHFAGENGVAAFTVINYIGNFVTLIMFGISDGISSIVSCNYGAGNLKRIRKTFYTAATINFIIGGSCVLILLLFSKSLIAVFLKENFAVIEMACTGAKIYAFSFLFNGFNIIQSGYHTAVGNALNSFLIAAGRGILGILIGIMIFPAILGLNGIWITLPFAEIMTLGFCLILMMKNKRLYFGNE